MPQIKQWAIFGSGGGGKETAQELNVVIAGACR